MAELEGMLQEEKCRTFCVTHRVYLPVSILFNQTQSESRHHLANHSEPVCAISLRLWNSLAAPGQSVSEERKPV